MPSTATPPVGLSVREFCRITGISRPWYYSLIKRYPDKVDVVKIGAKVLVLTSPETFLRSFKPTNAQAAS